MHTDTRIHLSSILSLALSHMSRVISNKSEAVLIGFDTNTAAMEHYQSMWYSAKLDRIGHWQCHPPTREADPPSGQVDGQHSKRV
jgi:hypothetical protein